MDIAPEGHTVDEDGEHDPDVCYTCLLGKEVTSSCRCAACCRHLILEASLEDAVREPRVKEEGSPIKGFTDELEGYLLNAADGPCVFLDRGTNLCAIYETRPLMCRLFDCNGEGRELLIELGILKREDLPAESPPQPNFDPLRPAL